MYTGIVCALRPRPGRLEGYGLRSHRSRRAQAPLPELKRTAGRGGCLAVEDARTIFGSEDLSHLLPGGRYLSVARRPLLDDPLGMSAPVDREGEWRRPTLNGANKERRAPCLTEKMLSAKGEMSNIFLHLCLNIDIAQ